MVSALLRRVATALLRQAGEAAACVPVEGAMDVPGWLACQIGANAGLIGAFTGIGLLVIALVSLGIKLVGLLREKGRDEERTDAADTRIADLALPVRLTLARSLEESWRLDDAPIYRWSRAKELQASFVEHKRHVEEMRAEAAGASPGVTSGVRRAARLFWSAVDGVEELAAVEIQDSDDDPPERSLEGYRKAKKATEECVDVLRRLDAPSREAEG